MTQEQITANKNALDMLYKAMGWNKDDGYWRPHSKSEIYRRKRQRKPDHKCYVCKKTFLKTEMYKDEYHSTRIVDGRVKQVTNTVYRCNKCYANYKPRRK